MEQLTILTRIVCCRVGVGVVFFRRTSRVRILPCTPFLQFTEVRKKGGRKRDGPARYPTKRYRRVRALSQMHSIRRLRRRIGFGHEHGRQFCDALIPATFLFLFFIQQGKQTERLLRHDPTCSHHPTASDRGLARATKTLDTTWPQRGLSTLLAIQKHVRTKHVQINS